MGLDETGEALRSCGAAMFKFGFGITLLMVFLGLLVSIF